MGNDPTQVGVQNQPPSLWRSLMINCNCTLCNKPIKKTKSDYNKTINHFCSSSCSAKFNNKLRKKIRYCKNCEKELTTYQSKYCSKQCQQNKQRLDKIQNGTAGVKAIKTYLENISNSCSICKMKNTWNNKPIVMVLDHIDGNSENNNLSNLRLVCPNCDSQLPTFKSRNKGNGRHNRRKRYKEGKSY